MFKLIYNATGQKVQKVVTDGTTVTTTDYLGGYQYRKKTASEPVELQYFPTAEGYVEPNGSSFKYVYQYKDHLGNIRLSYTKDTATGSLKILEESNYYPFGLKHNPYNTITPTQEYKVKYQGQERQDELGLNWDSFKWRNYDYIIGRFISVDPLSEKYSYQSHYNFSENRVIDARELEGLEAVLVHGTWADRNDKQLYSFDKADYKNGSTWQKSFSEKIAIATGWGKNSIFEYTWSGKNTSESRDAGGVHLAAQLMSDNNPYEDIKHATLIGNVSKLVIAIST